jgi:hypothetical protein
VPEAAATKTPPDSMGNGWADPAEMPLRTALLRALLQQVLFQLSYIPEGLGLDSGVRSGGRAGLCWNRSLWS